MSDLTTRLQLGSMLKNKLPRTPSKTASTTRKGIARRPKKYKVNPINVSIVRLRNQNPSLTYLEIANIVNAEHSLKKPDRLSTNMVWSRCSTYAPILEGLMEDVEMKEPEPESREMEIESNDISDAPSEAQNSLIQELIAHSESSTEQVEMEDSVPIALSVEDPSDVEDEVPLAVRRSLVETEAVLLQAVAKAKSEFWQRVADQVNLQRDVEDEWLTARDAMEWYGVLKA